MIYLVEVSLSNPQWDCEELGGGVESMPLSIDPIHLSSQKCSVVTKIYFWPVYIAPTYFNKISFIIIIS
jgi:hypothetical protein